MLVPAATNYWLLLALLPILGTVAYYARYYLKSSRELKRIEAIKCSPVYSHITETANGLEIVHISNMSRTFLERLQRLVPKESVRGGRSSQLPTLSIQMSLAEIHVGC